jgi:cytochrome b-561
MDRNTRKGIHLGIQTAAFLLAVVGVRAVFKFHNEHSPPIANMYSLHSWLGIAVMVLWALQVRCWQRMRE